MSHTIQQGEHVFTVSAFLISEMHGHAPRVLLLKHPKLGQWLQPGGHIEPHQDPLEALIAEFRDEVGIDLTPYIKPLGKQGKAVILPPPAHLTKLRIPAGKPNPADPEHFMIDMAYVIRLPHRPEIRAGVVAEWIPRALLVNYDMPEDIFIFLRGQLRL